MIGSDILYESKHPEDLADAIDHVTHPNGRVTLADDLASTVWRHADRLLYDTANAVQKNPAYSAAWGCQCEAQAIKAKADAERLHTIFNELFGGLTGAHTTK